MPGGLRLTFFFEPDEPIKAGYDAMVEYYDDPYRVKFAYSLQHKCTYQDFRTIFNRIDFVKPNCLLWRYYDKVTKVFYGDIVAAVFRRMNDLNIFRESSVYDIGKIKSLSLEFCDDPQLSSTLLEEVEV